MFENMTVSYLSLAGQAAYILLPAVRYQNGGSVRTSLDISLQLAR